MTDKPNVIEYLTAPERFGNQTRLGQAIGLGQSSVAGRKKANSLSHDQMRTLLKVAPELGVPLSPFDFFPELASDNADTPSPRKAAA